MMNILVSQYYGRELMPMPPECT